MKYITLEQDAGIDFRTIAKIMSEKNYQMNHATARNILFSALKTLLGKTSNKLGIKISEKKMKELLKNQDLHDALTEVLFEISQDENANEKR